MKTMTTPGVRAAARTTIVRIGLASAAAALFAPAAFAKTATQ